MDKIKIIQYNHLRDYLIRNLLFFPIIKPIINNDKFVPIMDINHSNSSFESNVNMYDYYNIVGNSIFDVSEANYIKNTINERYGNFIVPGGQLNPFKRRELRELLKKENCNMDLFP